MTTPSKTKSRFERLLSEIFARWVCKKINICVQIASNQGEIKIRLSVKIVVALNFISSMVKVLHLKYFPVCNVYNGSIFKN